MTNIDCIPPVSDTCGDGADNNLTGTIICPILEPTVVIDSAIDAAGNTLSPDDIISPQEVTFKFSVQGNETAIEEADPQFECAVDDEQFNACSSPMTYLMEKGKHNFVVKLVPSDIVIVE
jgi:hypothetical protein